MVLKRIAVSNLCLLCRMWCETQLRLCKNVFFFRFFFLNVCEPNNLCCLYSNRISVFLRLFRLKTFGVLYIGLGAKGKMSFKGPKNF